MKVFSKFLLIGLGLLSLTIIIHARPLLKPVGGGDLSGFTPVQLGGAALTGSEVQELRFFNDTQFEAFLLVLDATPLIPTNMLSPRLGGTFWSLQHPNMPPWPGNVHDLPAWKLGDGSFLMSDLNFDYSGKHKKKSSLSVEAKDSLSPGDGDGYTNTYIGFTIDTNGLWLEAPRITNGVSSYNLRHGTNLVYAIETTTNLLQSFVIEAEVFPTDTNSQPLTLQNNSRQNLFVRAMDWTGVTHGGNTAPDWWLWQYFGTTNVTDTNLDYSANGYSFAYEYSNHIKPAVFAFTNLAVANNYVSTPTPTVQLDVAGSPYYAAVLVDDDNFTNAVWNTYSGTTVTVNLGSSQGWHGVWIGLRGHGDAPNAAVWQWKRLKLDLTAPALFITSPTNTTVSVPMIQLQGYSPEALSSISYDLTNATGLVTNQQVLVLSQYYDTNTVEFTTNYFQAFDVMLTNGVNTFTFHATDLAGNTTTLVTNFTLSYAAKTNAPNVQITWPQTVLKIASSSVTVRGQVDDATVQVLATITDTNGATNVLTGMVERTGRFWLDNLPLNPGTNIVTLTVTDAAGNTTNTTLNLVQDPMTLTLDAIGDTSQLWQPTINLTGHVSDPTATIYVNGVQGTNNGDGTWSAANVPNTAGGVAIFDLNACPAGSGDPANSVNKDKPWRLYRASDQQQMDDAGQYRYAVEDGMAPTEPGEYYPGPTDYEAHWSDHYDVNWQDGVGGTGHDHSYYKGVDDDSSAMDYYETASVMTWTPTNGVEVDTDIANGGTQTTNSVALPNFVDEHCVVNDPQTSPTRIVKLPGSDTQVEVITGSDTYTRTADTTWRLETGGRAGATTQRLWQFSGTATAILDKRTAFYGIHNTNAIPCQQIAIGGLGKLKTDTNLWVTLPDGTNMDVTPTVAGNDFYTFTVSANKFKNKPDWQADVRAEIDNDSNVQIENYLAGNGFMNNRANIQAVYAFYQKLFTGNQNFLWAGLAKLAGAPVYAGLSDAQHVINSTTNFAGAGAATNAATVTNFVNSFQGTLISMNIAIMNDLAWQFEAYKNGGTNAIYQAWAGSGFDNNVLDQSAMNAWVEIDRGIQNGNLTLVQQGNQDLLQREQQQVLANGYIALNALDPLITWGMSQFAENPVPGGLSFITMEPSGNIANYPNRWDWITHPTTGMWWLWLGASTSTRLGWVQIPLVTRAANYAIYTPVY